MKTCNIPRLLVAGTHSSCGKTTVFCALAAGFKQRGKKVIAYKSGPDYIDPMFHERVLTTPSRNLDLFLFGRRQLGKQRASYLFTRHSRGAQLALCEGAMGYFDGVAATAEAGAFAVSEALSFPTVLVVDGTHASLSLGAVIHGFSQLDTAGCLKGFIVNKCKPSVYSYFKETWEHMSGVKALGFLPAIPECVLAERHLGLLTAGEVQDLQKKIAVLQNTAQQTMDWQALEEIAHNTLPVYAEDLRMPPLSSVRLAIAKDRAFCFYYADNLQLLQDLGAELYFFSPLTDTQLPPCDGIYLGGGYPELYAKELAANYPLKTALHTAIQQGTPCFAECGGFLYLLTAWHTGNNVYTWSNVLSGTATLQSHPVRFGYSLLKMCHANVWGEQGTIWPMHEFHYSDSTNNGKDCLAEKVGKSRQWRCQHATETLFAGYAHFHFWGNPQGAMKFIRTCARYRQQKEEL